MEKLKELILRKPQIFLLVSFVYFFLVVLLKWRIHPTVETVWFVLGGGIGIFFLDAAELFFALTPSPFRSVVFCALFIIVSLFVVTSSGVTLASGLVLSLYLQMILWQIGEWKVVRNLTSWFRMIAAPISLAVQQAFFLVFSMMFLLESYFFIQ